AKLTTARFKPRTSERRRAARRGHGIKDESGMTDLWSYLMQQFDPFSPNFGIEVAEPSYVAAWAGETCNKPITHWIGDCRKYYRDCCCNALECPRYGSAIRKN